LTAITFPCESRGYSFLRCYKLKRDGLTVARAVSVWALIDTETRSLVKVNDFNLGLVTYDALDIPLSRIVIPKSIETVGTYKVNYDDTDQNRHMNNTKYPDLYSDFLPLENRRIASMTISYFDEAPMGELLTVQKCEYDDAYYFRTVRSDGKINSEAEIRLTKI
jgi:acyl-ACP thioesterase